MKKHLLLVIPLMLIALISTAKKYKGAEIRTNESFLYGKFEVKMKSADASGMLISFFTFYDSPDFEKNWNEIDIEILGRYQNEIQFNSITAGPSGRLPHEKRHVLDYNPHEDFHVYAFEWTPTYIAFFVDGQEVFKQADEWVKTMNRKQKIMMNIWPSEFWDWTGPWDETKLPLYAMYDYVKYYEFKPSGDFELSWEDNFEKIDYSRWSFATHTFDGNGCDFDPSYAKTKEGYLILTLANAETPKTSNNSNKIEIADKSKGRATLSNAFLESQTSIKISFGSPVHRMNAKKENFKIEGVEILKVKFAIDMTNLELITSPIATDKDPIMLFTAPNQPDIPYTQKIKLKMKQ